MSRDERALEADGPRPRVRDLDVGMEDVHVVARLPPRSDTRDRDSVGVVGESVGGPERASRLR